MSICLATTWYPRGELPRLTRLLPILKEKYAHIVISYFPSEDLGDIEHLLLESSTLESKMIFYLNDDRKTGRYMALQKALETSSNFIHYADMDRLIHWVETKPDEWMQSIERIEKFDCIVFGRTPGAFHTHPQSIITTEKISNQVVSYLLKKEMDVSAGSKSFSRSAAGYIIEHGQQDNSIATDAEWPLLLKQAGFRLEYIQVSGLDWESADRFQPHAASPNEQKEAAIRHDSDPNHWMRRVEIAGDIIQTAFEVVQRKPVMPEMMTVKAKEFDYEAVFNVDDYLYFYSETLTDERTNREVDALVRLLKLDKPEKILDLACGFGRHANRLALMGHSMTGVDIMPGFLEIARRDANQKGVEVNYQQDDMRHIAFTAQFDCVLLLFTAFGYFSDEDNLQVLINIRNALLPGGLFFMDVLNRDAYPQKLQPCEVHEKNGGLMINRLNYDTNQRRLYNRRIVIRDGIRKDQPYFVRLYNPDELQVLFEQAGLMIKNFYDGWDASELNPETRRLIVVAQKPGNV